MRVCTGQNKHPRCPHTGTYQPHPGSSPSPTTLAPALHHPPWLQPFTTPPWLQPFTTPSPATDLLHAQAGMPPPRPPGLHPPTMRCSALARLTQSSTSKDMWR